MKIFTFKNFLNTVLFTFLILPVTCFAIPKSFIGTGNWSLASNWSPAVVPTSADAVTIPNGKTVNIDVVNAYCSSIDFTSGNSSSYLNILGTNKLNVAGNVNILDGDLVNLLAVGAGTLNVGGNILIYGNGNKVGKLTVSTGTINITGDFGFVAIGVGNVDNKIVDVTGTGSITVGGKFTNPGSGTVTPGSIDNIYINLSYFKSNSSGLWGTLSNWQNSWDGITYFSSNMLPSSVALKIEIAATHIITSMPAITLSNSTVLDVSGSLDCGLNQITGTGSFNLNSGATLITSHASGLSGSVLVSGTKTFSSLANYEFKGASTGTFLTTPTALTVNNLTINYAPGVNLSSSITVNGALNLPGGSFNIGSNILTINGAVTGAGSTTGLTGSANSDLVIGGSGDLNLGFNQTSSPSRSIKNYTQSRNAIVTLSNNMELNELMNLTGSSAKFASNGYLTLISTATKNANIGQLLNGADVTGNVNVQLYITGVTRSARYISTPINDNDASLTKKTFAQIKDYVIITGPQGGVGFDAGGKVQPYAITLALYNEKAEAKKPSYVSVSNIAQLINPGIGFSMFFRGNRSSYSAKVNAPFATPESVTLSLNGPINKFSKSVTLTNTNNPLDLYNGYNLVGNPYPSTIDFHQIPKTVISDQFITVKPNGTQASYKEAGAVGNNGGTRYVQPGQAFYLITGQSSAVLTFVEAFKSTQTLSNGFLSAPKETLSMSNNRVLNKNIIPGIIRINLQDAENTDETTIVFKQDESANADSQDVLFLSGSTVSLSSLSDDDKKMAINMMPELKNINEVRLNVNSSSSGLLKLNFTDLSSTDGYQVFLKDALFSDTLQDVKKLPSYKFMVDKTSSATFGMNRLSVIFKPEPIEPPKLFTAEKIKSGVELRWVAEKAKEIEYFEIEISTDSILFRKAGFISNASLTMNVEYSFVDKSPVSGKNYYRVKQVNRNGKFIYTSIKSVNLLAGNNFKIVIYPNPAKDHIQIQLANRPIGSIDAYIYSISGKKLNKINFATNENLNVNLAGLNPGLYLIELQEAGAKKVVGRAKFTVGL